MIFLVRYKSTKTNGHGDNIEVHFAKVNPQHQFAERAKAGNQALIGLGTLQMNRATWNELQAVLIRGNRDGMIRVEEVTTFKRPDLVIQRIRQRGVSP